MNLELHCTKNEVFLQVDFISSFMGAISTKRLGNFLQISYNTGI